MPPRRRSRSRTGAAGVGTSHCVCASSSCVAPAHEELCSDDAVADVAAARACVKRFGSDRRMRGGGAVHRPNGESGTRTHCARIEKGAHGRVEAAAPSIDIGSSGEQMGWVRLCAALCASLHWLAVTRELCSSQDGGGQGGGPGQLAGASDRSRSLRSPRRLRALQESAFFQELKGASPFFLMAGPNVIQSEEHCLKMCRQIKEVTGARQPLVWGCGDEGREHRSFMGVGSSAMASPRGGRARRHPAHPPHPVLGAAPPLPLSAQTAWASSWCSSPPLTRPTAPAPRRSGGRAWRRACGEARPAARRRGLAAAPTRLAPHPPTHSPTHSPTHHHLIATACWPR